MTGATMILRGVVHGRTIELDEEIGLAEGTTVNIVIHPQDSGPPNAGDARASIDASAGACADEAEEWDAFDKWYRDQRQHDRPLIGDDDE